MLIPPVSSLNKSRRIIYLTNINLPCFIDVGAAEKQFAAMLFGNETIAHDKGKPVAKQGRKAVSLRQWEAGDTTSPKDLKAPRQ